MKKESGMGFKLFISLFILACYILVGILYFS